MPEISESIAKELVKRKVLEVDEQGCYALIEKKKSMQPLYIVAEYIKMTRLKKRDFPYPITPKHFKLLKNKITAYNIESVLAAWDTYLEEKFEDSLFWGKGCTVDQFCTGQCFTLCLEAPYTKQRIKWHEENTLGLRPLPKEQKGECMTCLAQTCKLRSKSIRKCPRKQANPAPVAKAVVAVMKSIGGDDDNS